MASYKVIKEGGWNYKGKFYAKNETVVIAEEKARTFLNLDYLKPETAKEVEKRQTAKAPAKKTAAKPAPVKGDVVGPVDEIVSGQNQ